MVERNTKRSHLSGSTRRSEGRKNKSKRGARGWMVITPPPPAPEEGLSLQSPVHRHYWWFTQNQSAGALTAALLRFSAALSQPLADLSPGPGPRPLFLSASPPNPGHDSGPPDTPALKAQCGSWWNPSVSFLYNIRPEKRRIYLQQESKQRAGKPHDSHRQSFREQKVESLHRTSKAGSKTIDRAGSRRGS